MNISIKENYLSNISLTSYLQLISKKFPEFYETFWFERPNSSKVIREMNEVSSDFEGSKKGGRGDYYQKAQRNPSVRMTGIEQILQLAIGNADIKNLPSTYKILDVLGGDGLLARAFKLLQKGDNFRQPILTSDIAADMIIQALKYDLPAIRQKAQFLFNKNESFNAVILAYGTHHIPENDRIIACQEAYKVLKPGGNVVVHDFEKNSPVAEWFNHVVDTYSITGHKFSHFTRDNLYFYLKKNNFKNIRISQIYDPFIVRGINKHRVFEELMYYIFNMYGLEKLIRRTNKKDLPKKVLGLVQKYIHYDFNNIKEAKPHWKKSISFYEENDQFVAELPRVALVGVGTK